MKNELMGIIGVTFISAFILAICMGLGCIVGYIFANLILPIGSNVKPLSFIVGITIGVILYYRLWIFIFLSNNQGRKQEKIFSRTITGFIIGLIVTWIVGSPIFGLFMTDSFAKNPLIFILIGGLIGAIIGLLYSIEFNKRSNTSRTRTNVQTSTSTIHQDPITEEAEDASPEQPTEQPTEQPDPPIASTSSTEEDDSPPKSQSNKASSGGFAKLVKERDLPRVG